MCSLGSRRFWTALSTNPLIPSLSLSLSLSLSMDGKERVPSLVLSYEALIFLKQTRAR